ncbi:MAG: glycosyltransferase [Bacteroidota bacterium]
MMEKQNTLPLVSVLFSTYNHEEFIARAVESVLRQKTSFRFELVIGDDCSTDKTTEILRGYKEKYSDIIKLFVAESNQGVLKNSLNILKNCKGKYFAILEGDDYWTYEFKLQRQIDFLEQNSDYEGCFHDAEIIPWEVNDDHSKEQYLREHKYYSQCNNYKSDFYSWDVIERNIVPTASFVFRNNKPFEQFFEKFSDIKLSLIWALQIYVVGKGKLFYFNEVWSAYNDHSMGISKTQSLFAFKLSNILVLKRFVKEKEFRYVRHFIYRTITHEYLQILVSTERRSKKEIVFYKTLIQFVFYYLKTLRFEIKNIFENKKYLKNQ